MARVHWIATRLIQANMLFRLTIVKFLADLHEVLSHKPDLLCLNEVSGRRDQIKQAAVAHGYHLHHPPGPGEYDGVALLADQRRYDLLTSGVKQMHKNPPGRPTARYCTWMILWDAAALRYVIFIGTHTLAAVERGNKLNRIARTRYYVQHIIGLPILARQLRRRCKREYGRSGQVYLAGDMNWNWSPKSWIKRMLCGYFQSSHLVCKGKVRTLGRRSVDVVLKRGGATKFVRHCAIRLFSDHNGYCVDMRVSKWRGGIERGRRRL